MMVIPPIFEGSARERLGQGPPGTSNNTRPPSDLDKHMDRRQQLKHIRYHPSLIEILNTKLDERIGNLPQDSRIVQESIFSFLAEVHREAANEAELQVHMRKITEAAVEISSMLCFLPEEASRVSNFPLIVMPSHVSADIPDDEIRFPPQYHEMSSFESRPLKPSTIKAVRCFDAALTFLK
jgi:hypothetical protein